MKLLWFQSWQKDVYGITQWTLYSMKLLWFQSWQKNVYGIAQWTLYSMKLLWFQSCQKEVENKERKKVDLEPELKKSF